MPPVDEEAGNLTGPKQATKIKGDTGLNTNSNKLFKPKIIVGNKLKSPFTAGFDMSDEEVIRRRLLIDGDGTGDDRRINVLLKSFIKWANCADSDNTLHERMLSQLAQCEFAQKKSRLVSGMSQEELKSYERMSKDIGVQIEEAKKEIEKTKVELQEAKRVRKNRIEYDVLAKVINEQPDRLETDVKLATLRKELGTLKEKSEQLEHKLEMRRKQFHVLISSIHSLQGMLDESDEEIMDVSLENYEDVDVSMSPKAVAW